jgi:hypothetical protein
MKSIRKHSEKEKFWRHQMAAAEKFRGSQREFCKSQGLSINMFQYWRYKFEREGKSRLSEVAKPTPFVAVEVLQPEHCSGEMPQAQWLAELILHLQRGLR